MTASDSDFQPHPSRGQPTDAQLAELAASLAKPITDLLGFLSTSAVSLVRAMIDEAYERGHRDGFAAASRHVTLDHINIPAAGGQTTIHLAAPPPPGPPAAVLDELERAGRPKTAMPA